MESPGRTPAADGSGVTPANLQMMWDSLQEKQPRAVSGVSSSEVSSLNLTGQFAEPIYDSSNQRPLKSKAKPRVSPRRTPTLGMSDSLDTSNIRRKAKRPERPVQKYDDEDDVPRGTFFPDDETVPPAEPTNNSYMRKLEDLLSTEHFMTQPGQVGAGGQTNTQPAP